MNKEFLKELKALAKKHGFEVLNQCVYCGEECHSDGPDDNWMLTFSKKREDE